MSEIIVYKLTNNFIHSVVVNQNFETVVLHDESSPQSQHANGKKSTGRCIASTGMTMRVCFSFVRPPLRLQIFAIPTLFLVSLDKLDIKRHKHGIVCRANIIWDILLNIYTAKEDHSNMENQICPIPPFLQGR